VLIEVENSSKTPEPAALRGRRQLEVGLEFGAANCSDRLEFHIAEWSCLASTASGPPAREISAEAGTSKCELLATRARALSPRLQQSLPSAAATACVPVARISNPSCPPRQAGPLVTAKSLSRSRRDFRDFHLVVGAAEDGSATCDA
jgi:hypothetical protein